MNYLPKQPRFLLLFVFLIILTSLLVILFIVTSGFGLFLTDPPRSSSFESSVIKITTSEEGVYEFGLDELAELISVPENIAQEDIKIYYRGVAQPIWFSGNGSELKVRFYAQLSDSLYSKNNVYWLVIGGLVPEWVLEKQGNIDKSRYQTQCNWGEEFPEQISENIFISCNQINDNKIYKPQVDQEDHWFLNSLTAPAIAEYDFNIDYLAPGPGHIYIEGWGDSISPDLPDHNLVIKLNGVTVINDSWDGKGSFVIDNPIKTGFLREGINTIELQLPGVSGVDIDVIYLDQIKIVYPQFLSSEDDSLTFTSHGGIHQIQNITTPVDVFDISDHNAVENVYQFDDEDVRFEGVIGHTYWAIGKRGYKQPENLGVANASPDLRRSFEGADYISIGPAELLEPVQPLLKLREEQGLQVMSVAVETIYDQFGSGLPEPEAIRAFLKYAMSNWSTKPRYLLLVGDASYDPKGFISSEEVNRLPVFFIDTIYGGQTSSDNGYAQLEDENWNPESIGSTEYNLAVGRFPAQNAEQVRTIVDKTLYYENEIRQKTRPVSWQQGILAVADGQEDSFKSDAITFLDLFPDYYQTNLISPIAGDTNVNLQIVDGIEQGNLLVAYFGHGSINMWGKDRLFNSQDVIELSTENRSSIFINMTCLTGLFTHPTNESLAETMLWYKDGSAVAMIAPTSLTLSTDQNQLVLNFVNTMLINPNGRIGDILTSAREGMLMESKGLQEVAQTFLLFGDPALTIPMPEK